MMDRVSNEDYAPGACLALALMRQRQHFLDNLVVRSDH